MGTHFTKINPKIITEKMDPNDQQARLEELERERQRALAYLRYVDQQGGAGAQNANAGEQSQNGSSNQKGDKKSKNPSYNSQLSTMMVVNHYEHKNVITKSIAF